MCVCVCADKHYAAVAKAITSLPTIYHSWKQVKFPTITSSLVLWPGMVMQEDDMAAKLG